VSVEWLAELARLTVAAQRALQAEVITEPLDSVDSAEIARVESPRTRALTPRRNGGAVRRAEVTAVSGSSSSRR
jgi:hypothetical protein